MTQKPWYAHLVPLGSPDYNKGYYDALNDAENMPIIKAAPELLEALEYYFDVLKEVRGEDWDKNPDHVLSKMLTAATKARGE